MNGQAQMVEIDNVWINLNAIAAVKVNPDQVKVWMVGDPGEEPWEFAREDAEPLLTALEFLRFEARL